MHDAAHIADRYLAVWNEADPARRRALLAESWTADARYTDPLADVRGLDAIDSLIAHAQTQFADLSFAVTGEPNGYGDHVRFSWRLGPDGGDSIVEGSDIAILDTGRIARIIGFLDKVPAA